MFDKFQQWFNKECSLSLVYDVAAISHIGARRINQDDYLCVALENHLLLIVADGLGGHQSGELAAKGLCEGIQKLSKQYEQSLLTNDDYGTVLSLWIQSAAKYMDAFIARQTSYTDAHTTLAMVLLNDENIYTAHLGDSRIYKLSTSQVTYQSRDDSLIQLLIDQGEIESGDIAHHPLQNILLQSVRYGVAPNMHIAKLTPLTLTEGVLLCSDGFWGNLSNADFFQLVDSHNINKTLAELVLLAEENGGKKCDNITAIFARHKV